MSKYEVQINYKHNNLRPWVANILVDGVFLRDQYSIAWVTQGRKRKTVVRRAENKIKKLRHKGEIAERQQVLRAVQAVEASELQERFTVE